MSRTLSTIVQHMMLFDYMYVHTWEQTSFWTDVVK